MRSMDHPIRLIVVVVTVMVLGGCFFRRDTSDCRSTQEYQQSIAVSSVMVPPTLSAPDESTKLVIPPEPRPAQPLADTAACLAKPPDYFRKPTAADAEEKGSVAPAPLPAPAPAAPPAAALPAAGH